MLVIKCVSRAHCLKLENLLGVLSLGKINSPSFAALHLGLEPCEIYFMHTETLTSVAVVQVLFRQAYLLRFLACNFSAMSRGLCFTQAPCSLALTVVFPSVIFSEPLGAGVLLWMC